jgi:predicted MPP superfamily phosphohydrolase
MPLAYGLIHGVDLSLPRLPPRLVGARIAHLSDLHITRRNARLDRVAAHLAAIRLDLLVLTGDFITAPGNEPAAMEVLGRMLEQVRPRWGSVGVFGNHDTPHFIDLCRSLPVTWLRDQVHRLPDVGLEILGLGWPPDALALASQLTPPDATPGDGTLRLGLSHSPSSLAALSDLGVELVLAGHTHGGQIRLPTGIALKNANDLPLHLTSGVLRHRNCLCAVSRGIGEVNFPLRLFCPPHIPMYTLRRGALPGQHTHTILRIEHW